MDAEDGEAALGLKRGAIATSTMWDTADIGVVGTNDEDMAVALNRVRELQGGLVICSDGKVIAEIALPLCGLFSPDKVEAMVFRLDQVQLAAAALGCAFPDIRLTLSVLSTAGIPSLRICESGLVDVKAGQLVGLFVD